MNGIDVHGGKGPVSWPDVKRSGIGFAWVKKSEGASFDDPRWRSNLNSGRAAGLTMGVYHFARPDNNTPEAEVAHFLRGLDLRPGDLLPALDFEHPPASASWALRFLQLLEGHIGAPPVFYSYPSFVASMKPGRQFARYPLWYASPSHKPSGTPSPWSQIAVWQAQARAVKGVDGPADFDVLLGTLPVYRKTTPPAPTPAPKPKKRFGGSLWANLPGPKKKPAWWWKAEQILQERRGR